ncbi:PREDICTED: chaperone protein dnaJ 20, chloroplastic [Theobroma cacao]|uniref:Chaperone protein dnaJ 20, chloroplastic n=1 Tax=Theobroma cacao TaxID=3641 RepID=A0AB32VFE1_THECC|nr:PREDICTED: chaperone protein dnaJ 20, chloroplastic [Theobroma cacao]
MNCSFASSLSDAKPFLSHVRSHKPQGKPILTAFSCRACEKDQSTNFYKVLSLNSNQASIDEIKKAYRTMGLQHHPDVCHPFKKDESTRMFVQLHAAYKTLSDPVLREEYDCILSSRNFEGKFRADFADHYSRIRWQEQIQELKRRSSYRMEQKEISWGNRMRAKNNEKRDK